MFVFETSIKLMYWSFLVYDYQEAASSPYSVDTALSLYDLENFELFWEKTLVGVKRVGGGVGEEWAGGRPAGVLAFPAGSSHALPPCPPSPPHPPSSASLGHNGRGGVERRHRGHRVQGDGVAGQRAGRPAGVCGWGDEWAGGGVGRRAGGGLSVRPNPQVWRTEWPSKLPHQQHTRPTTNPHPCARAQVWRTEWPEGVGSSWRCSAPLVHQGFLKAWRLNGFSERVIGRLSHILYRCADQQAAAGGAARPVQVYCTG